MNILSDLQRLAMQFILPLVVILIGLLLAWIVARLGAYLVRRALGAVNLDERVSSSLDTKTDVTRWVSGLTFWVLFIVVVWQLAILAQNIAGVDTAAVQTPLGVLFAEWLPKLVNVGVFLLVAWLVATVLRFLVVRVLNMTQLDEWLGEKVVKGKAPDTNQSIGNAVFWLTFLVFIPSILGSLGLGEAAGSVQGLVNQILSYIPGIIGAIIILVLGALLARIVRQIVTGFLQSIGTDSIGERVGLSKSNNTQPLSMLLGTVAYVIVLVVVVVQALNILKLPVISDLGVQLVGGLLGVILSALGAAVILSIAYYVAKFISEIASSLLAGIGINRLPSALGFKTAKGPLLSDMLGYVVLVGIMLIAIQGTAQYIGLTMIAALVGSLLSFGANVLLGVAIFFAGIYFSNIASDVILSTGGGDAAFLANITRWAILIFVAGIALSQAGVTLADSVIQIIFAPIGVAVALAFGLGGRDQASKQLDKWFNRKSTRG